MGTNGHSGGSQRLKNRRNLLKTNERSMGAAGGGGILSLTDSAQVIDSIKRENAKNSGFA